MKTSVYTERICKGHCAFYKPGKERLVCGAYEFLRENLSPGEMASESIPGMRFSPLGINDSFLKDLLCRRCDFRAGGCGFAAGGDSPPCGGYLLAGRLTGSARRR